jgi:tetraprenyl-beta-curcumene synthase
VLAFITSTNARHRAELQISFARAALVYWGEVFPRMRRHVARWERLAQRIPDPDLRRLALAALREKRTNIEGASAFAAFAPRHARGQVTSALSSFQAAYNLLDMLGEQPSPDPVADGRRLHEALPYALDPDATPRDWYEHHPHRNDNGYLARLLEECRSAAFGLPSYALAAPLACAAAERIVAFQSLNLSESQGDHAALEHWAHAATPAGSDLEWWETAGAAGSSLAVYALLGAAAKPDMDLGEAQALDQAYFPWVGGLHSLLDNLIDKHEDEAAGHRSLLEYYDPLRAAERMRWLTEQARAATSSLPRGGGHSLIFAAMIASYLTDPQAHTPELEPVADAVIGAAGGLMGPALMVLRLRQLAKPRSEESSGASARTPRAGPATADASAPMATASPPAAPVGAPSTPAHAPTKDPGDAPTAPANAPTAPAHAPCEAPTAPTVPAHAPTAPANASAAAHRLDNFG